MRQSDFLHPSYGTGKTERMLAWLRRPVTQRIIVVCRDQAEAVRWAAEIGLERDDCTVECRPMDCWHSVPPWQVVLEPRESSEGR